MADCQNVLVYLGAGTVWDTKLVATASKKKYPPKSNLKLPLSSGEEYSPPSTPVYDPAIKRKCTRSMGLIETESSKSSSSESEPEPELSSSHGQPASEPEVPKPQAKTSWPTQENLTLSRKTFTKSAGAPVQPGGSVHYVENNFQNK